jgi:hypothetical protein
MSLAFRAITRQNAERDGTEARPKLRVLEQGALFQRG